MNEIMYSFRDSEVRVVMKDNEPWFVAKDVCNILEINNVSQTVTRLKEKQKGIISNDGAFGLHDLIIINESGLYQLIFSSRKEEAEIFRDWVFEEVLPSIRKRGIYATEEVVNKAINDPQFLIDLLTSFKETKDALKKSENKIAILTHVNKTYTATEIAKELNLRSAQVLNNKLKDLKIQYQQNKTWVLYSDYSNKGYTEIKQKSLDNGKVVYDRHFTQMGREFILELFNKGV